MINIKGYSLQSRHQMNVSCNGPLFRLVCFVITTNTSSYTLAQQKQVRHKLGVKHILLLYY